MNRILTFAICVLLSSAALANSFRCGKSLVKTGDSSNTLTKKCGDPSRKHRSKELINDHGREFRAGVSNWVYSRKAGKDMIVSIYNGEIIKIQID